MARFILTWGVIVLTFDLVASVTSIVAGIPYGWFSLGSLLIYLSAGYIAAPRFGLPKTIAAVAVVALVDATLGWGLSLALGAASLDDPDFSVPVVLISGAASGLLFGAVVGAVGGWVGSRRSAVRVE